MTETNIRSVSQLIWLTIRNHPAAKIVRRHDEIAASDGPVRAVVALLKARADEALEAVRQQPTEEAAHAALDAIDDLTGSDRVLVAARNGASRKAYVYADLDEHRATVKNLIARLVAGVQTLPPTANDDERFARVRWLGRWRGQFDEWSADGPGRATLAGDSPMAKWIRDQLAIPAMPEAPHEPPGVTPIPPPTIQTTEKQVEPRKWRWKSHIVPNVAWTGRRERSEAEALETLEQNIKRELTN